MAPAVLADLTGFRPLLLQVGTNELMLDDSEQALDRAALFLRQHLTPSREAPPTAGGATG